MHMRTLVIIFALLILVRPTQAQELERIQLDEGGGSSLHSNHGLSSRIPPHSPKNTLQFLMDFGVNVEDHPNGYGRHAHQSPAIADVCNVSPSNGEPLGAACGRILWDTGHGFPTTGATYLASVPHRVELSGDNVWWEPSIHCITWDMQRRALYKVSQGPTCMNIINAETQRMEWRIGGKIHGMNPDTPGIYEGWIPVTIHESDHQWIIDVPIRYERLRAETTCTLNAGGDVRMSGLEYDPENPIKGEIRITSDRDTRSILSLTGTAAAICGRTGSGCAGLSYSTGWVRFTTNSPTWSMTISATQVSPSFRAVGSAETWTWIVGYYDAGGVGYVIDTDEAPSFTESANVWADADGWRHLFLGGFVNPENWESQGSGGGTFSGSGTVTLMCG